MFIIRAAPLAAVLLIAACNTPTATIKAGDLPDDQARTYLIFADQLQRVRNIWKKPIPVCLAMPRPHPAASQDYLDAAVVPTWPKVMARLREDNETAAVKLKIESSLDCLRQFVPVDNGPRPILPKGAAMVFAGGQPGNLVFGNCGHKFSGGLLAAGFDHYVTYDSTVTDGAMRLSGGEVCEINMGRF